MIEPTDEMVAALKRIHREQFQFGVLNLEQTFRKGLAAVLALVERDYRLVAKTPFEKNPDWTCRRCQSALSPCLTCGVPAQCGDGFCTGCAS